MNSSSISDRNNFDLFSPGKRQSDVRIKTNQLQVGDSRFDGKQGIIRIDTQHEIWTDSRDRDMQHQDRTTQLDAISFVELLRFKKGHSSKNAIRNRTGDFVHLKIGFQSDKTMKIKHQTLPTVLLGQAMPDTRDQRLKAIADIARRISGTA